MFTPPFPATRQLRTVFWTSFRFLTIVANFIKTTVAQSVLTPISSNRNVAHGVLNKFQQSRQFQAKRQLRRVFSRQFRATRQLRSVFFNMV